MATNLYTVSYQKFVEKSVGAKMWATMTTKQRESLFASGKYQAAFARQFPTQYALRSAQQQQQYQMRGPGGNKTNANAEFQAFETGGILKRDRLVSGLVHINAIHRPIYWKNNFPSIELTFVKKFTNTYQNAGVGKYIQIYTSATASYVFWFKAYSTTSQPTVPGLITAYVQVDISSVINAEDVADAFAAAADGNANFDALWRIHKRERDISVANDLRKDNVVYLRWQDAGTDIGTHNTNTTVTINAIAGSAATVNDAALSTETDFKQGLFNNSTKDDGSGVAVTSRRSPWMSNEPPSWRGEMYDDGRFNTGTNNDSHQLNGRFGKMKFDDSRFEHYDASTGDHATYLYYVTAATKVKDFPRAWGKRIRNDDISSLITATDTATGKDVGDFNQASDVNRYTEIDTTNYITKQFIDESTALNNVPLGTGSMQVDLNDANASSVNPYRRYAIYVDSIPVVAGDKLNFSWHIDQNVTNSTTAGAGLCGIEVRTTSNPLSGSAIFTAPGGGQLSLIHI